MTQAKKVRYALYFVLSVISTISAVFLVWLVEPRKVLDIRNSPVPIRPAEQRADELVFAHVDYCKLKSVSGLIRRSLVNERQRIFLPLESDGTKKGCQAVETPILIPLNAPTGMYHIHWDITYQINPFIQVVEQFDSEQFTVTE